MRAFSSKVQHLFFSFLLVMICLVNRDLLADEKNLSGGVTSIIAAGPVFEDVFPFRDDFEVDSANRWNVVVGYLSQGEGDPVIDDYTVEFNYDYSTTPFNRFFPNAVDLETFYIPPSPNGNGTTHGVKITVNKLDDIEQCFAVNLYPKSTIFKGDYVLKFDMFLNHGSYGAIGSGTTESAIFGLNCTGTNANWQIFSGASQLNAGLPTKSDGLWFGITGDGGAGTDLRAAVGTTNGPARNLEANYGGFLDRDGDGSFDVNDEAPYLRQLYASPPAEAPGVIGKRWVEVEVMQRDNVITWKMDNHLIASRENSSDFRSGLPMLGYMDIFSSIAEERDQAFVIFDNVRILPIRTIVVDTIDNTSGSSDGKTSLSEALSAGQENAQIVFNLPTPGPFYIQTPVLGYPLITNDGVTINGYSQVGASPNFNTILQTNSAVIQIVLDSRLTTGGRTLVGESTGNTGFGLSESAILGIKNAKGVEISGLAFLSRITESSDIDPDIYSIALVNESAHAHIHGCWFGIDPQKNEVGSWVVAAGRSAIASFRDGTMPENSYYQGYSWGLTIGTDGDSVNDLAEFNVMVGNELAIHLQTPNTKVAGNFINVLPDGTFFNGANDTNYAKGKSIEAIENGKADEMLIGTDGNSISDSNERNRFGPVRYDVFAEFWRSATNVVFAGNYVGIGIDGSMEFTSNASLISVRKNSDIRVGSDLNGFFLPDGDIGDALEGNHIYNLKHSLFDLHGSNFDGDGSESARLSFRGNNLVNNSKIFSIIPHNPDKISEFFLNPLAYPGLAYRPVISSSSTTDTFFGTVPEPNLAVSSTVIIDLYLADLVSASQMGAESQGKKYIASFIENSFEDQDPTSGSFILDITPLGLTPDEMKALTITANYIPDNYLGFNLNPWTSSFSGLTTDEELKITDITWSKPSVIITRTVGRGPFRLEKRAITNPLGEWQSVDAEVLGNTFIYTPKEPALFYRIRSGF